MLTRLLWVINNKSSRKINKKEFWKKRTEAKRIRQRGSYFVIFTLFMLFSKFEKLSLGFWEEPLVIIFFKQQSLQNSNSLIYPRTLKTSTAHWAHWAQWAAVRASKRMRTGPPVCLAANERGTNNAHDEPPLADIRMILILAICKDRSERMKPRATYVSFDWPGTGHRFHVTRIRIVCRQAAPLLATKKWMVLRNGTLDCSFHPHTNRWLIIVEIRA